MQFISEHTPDRSFLIYYNSDLILLVLSIIYTNYDNIAITKEIAEIWEHSGLVTAKTGKRKGKIFSVYVLYYMYLHPDVHTPDPQPLQDSL